MSVRGKTKRSTSARPANRDWVSVARTSSGARWLLSVGLLLLLGGLVSPCAAAPPTQATSSRAAREEALRSIPFDKLDPDDRQRIAATTSSTSLYRRLPIQVTECDPDLYLFL